MKENRPNASSDEDKDVYYGDPGLLAIHPELIAGRRSLSEWLNDSIENHTAATLAIGGAICGVAGVVLEEVIFSPRGDKKQRLGYA